MTNIYNAIIAAFVECKPFPAWVEIGDETFSEIMKDGLAFDQIEWCEGRIMGTPQKFGGVAVKLRRYLVGWRVVSEPEGSDFFLADGPAEAYVRTDERGRPARMYIASEDFDEKEAVRFENWERNRAR